jgi:DNA-directed RNA polymerase subunit RPC12/RpoP
MSSMSCTSCGAPLEIENRFSKVLVCGYCGTHLKVSGEGLDISGKHPKLAEFPSIFNVGTRGTILGKPFKALGRMRYKTEDSYYDEWFIDYDGETAWFVEDEGTYSIFFEIFEAADFPDPGTISAGQNIEVAGKRVMVKEKGTSVVEGGEGELSYYQEPGTEVTYIDGVAEGKKISIETTEDEVEVFTGRPLLKRDIVVGG